MAGGLKYAGRAKANAGAGDSSTAANGNGYRAWNRLVSVTNGGTTHSYVYDAMGHSPSEALCTGDTIVSYYSKDWQDLQDNLVTGSGSTAQTQNVWGAGHVDDLV